MQFQSCFNILKKIYRGKAFEFILFIAFFSIPFLLFFQLLINNQVFIAGDGIGFYAAKTFLIDSIKNLQFPLWNPYLSNGVPFALDISNNAFYPISILLSFLPINYYIFAFYGIHLAIGGLFTFKFLQELKCSRFIALITSIIYVFSIDLGGFRKEHIGLIATAVWLPVILYFIQKYINSKQLKWLIFSSIAMALQFYTCFVQYMVYCDIVIFIYLLSWGIKERIKIKKILIDGFAWGITYVGLICIQLLPTLQLMNEYKKSGASDVSYGYFTYYSLAPVKLIMMVFPKIFGNDVFMPLSNGVGSYTSGIDIELFVGILVTAFIVFGILYIRTNFAIKLSLGILIGTFTFACLAQFHFLSKLLFKIPVLNGFRVPSRTIFIFIFFCYVVFAVSLTNIKKYDYKRKMNFFNIMISILFVAMLFAAIFFKIDGESHIDIIKNIFLLPGIVLVIYLLYYYIFGSGILKPEVFYNILAAIICISTVIQVFPFYKSTNISNPEMFDTKSQAVLNLENDLNYQKVLVAGSSSNSYNNYLGSNLNAANSIYSMNSYISFNNPSIYKLLYENQTPQFNSSGLYIGFNDINNIMFVKNDVLSMLGVKYIIDTDKSLKLNDNKIEYPGKTVKNVLDTDSIKIPASDNGQAFSYSEPVNLKANTFYEYSFNINSQVMQNQFYVDLFNGQSVQKKDISINSGSNSYMGFFYYTDNTTDNLFFRIISTPTNNMEITNLKLTEMETVTQDNVYKIVPSNSDTIIYENVNARDILYAPDSVKSVSSFDDIYSSPEDYSIDKISYIQSNQNEDLSGANTKIQIKSFTNNQIKANITADKQTFINFSQSYYPGWNAYVDGEKVKSYMVNGIMQGAFVPAGNHVIEFKFEPNILTKGLYIFLGTMVLILLFFLIPKIKGLIRAKQLK